MATHPPERLTRFDPAATEDTKRNFGRSLLGALDRLGVQPGMDFIVMPAHEQPSLMEELEQPEMGPFAKGSETSRKAALDNYPRAGSQRRRVLLEIARGQEHGRTREELATRLELDDNSVRPRVVELVNGGFIRETDKTRPTKAGSEASVLALTMKGMLALRDHDPEVAPGDFATVASDV